MSSSESGESEAEGEMEDYAEGTLLQLVTDYNRQGAINWLPPQTKNPKVMTRDEAKRTRTTDKGKKIANVAKMVEKAASFDNFCVMRWLGDNFPVVDDDIAALFSKLAKRGMLRAAKLLNEVYGAAVKLDYIQAFQKALLHDKAATANWLADFVKVSPVTLDALKEGLRARRNEPAIKWLEKRFPV